MQKTLSRERPRGNFVTFPLGCNARRTFFLFRGRRRLHICERMWPERVWHCRTRTPRFSTACGKDNVPRTELLPSVTTLRNVPCGTFPHPESETEIRGRALTASHASQASPASSGPALSWEAAVGTSFSPFLSGSRPTGGRRLWASTRSKNELSSHRSARLDTR